MLLRIHQLGFLDILDLVHESDSVQTDKETAAGVIQTLRYGFERSFKLYKEWDEKEKALLGKKLAKKVV